ncbi:hypothetical protein [Litorimonas sp. WD9-15]|uniref:hypothetical protein n=1 Tax=Litorimonas sp. WD9-15 TaxID=3418716 RepID=UPI003D05507C
MVRIFIALCAVAGLSACATKPAPALFQGSSGWRTLPNTTELVSTDVAAGELIADREIEFTRTGILQNDVKNMLGIVKMKAGSPVYAMSYGGAPRSFSPLAWCAPSTSENNVGSFLTGENDVECLMYNGLTGRAVRTDGNSSSRFFAANMTPTSTSIAIPDIKEGPVDFGRDLSLRLSAASLTGKTLDAIQYFHDGEDQTILRQQKLKYDENDSVLWSVWGGLLKLTRTGSEEAPRLKVEQVRPFSDVSLTNAQMLQLLEALAAVQNNKAGSVEGDN